MGKKIEQMRCAMCGQLKDVVSTTYTDFYCLECHQLVIYESRQAIKNIRSRIYYRNYKRK